MVVGLHKVINDIRVDAEFQYKFNVMSDGSATGKSYLLKLLEKSFLIDGNVKCIRIDYRHAKLSEAERISMIKGKDIILMDNIELYITKELIQSISDSSAMAIMAGRNLKGIRFEPIAFYGIKFTSTELRTNLHGGYGIDETYF